MTENDRTKRTFRKLIMSHLKVLRLTTRILTFYQDEKTMDVLLTSDRLEDCLDRIDDLVEKNGEAGDMLDELVNIKSPGQILSHIENVGREQETISWFGDSIVAGARIMARSLEKI